MDNSENNIKIANAWFTSFNEHNLETLLALYEDHAQHFSPKLKIRHPETNGFIRGKTELRAWWKDSFERLPHLKYTPSTLTANNNRVFMEYLRETPGETDLLVAEVLEIQNGKIVASRVYHG